MTESSASTTFSRKIKSTQLMVVARFEKDALERCVKHLIFLPILLVRFFIHIETYFEVSSTITVFHIRRGGMKGLLVTYPDEIFDVAWGNTIEERFRQAKMPEYDFAYRKSMLKYRGGPTAVEVHGVSEPMEAARLNFQFVVLLLYLGVDIKVRLDLHFYSFHSLFILLKPDRRSLNY